jgi:hypothetical protein
MSEPQISKHLCAGHAGTDRNRRARAVGELSSLFVESSLQNKEGTKFAADNRYQTRRCESTDGVADRYYARKWQRETIGNANDARPGVLASRTIGIGKYYG